MTYPENLVKIILFIVILSEFSKTNIALGSNAFITGAPIPIIDRSCNIFS